jgi:hypothetical protein
MELLKELGFCPNSYYVIAACVLIIHFFINKYSLISLNFVPLKCLIILKV